MPNKVFKYLLLLILVAITTSYAQILLNEGFDGDIFPPPGWTTYDARDEYNHILDYWMADRHGPHVAPGCAFAGKFGDNPHYRSDAWLITPRVQPTIGHNTLEFWYRGFNKNHEETLEIWISRTGVDKASFTIKQAVIGMKTWDYTKYTLNLSSFNNQLIYIAFRYVGSKPNRHGVFLDCVGGPGGGGVTYPVRDVGVYAIDKPDTLELPGSILLQAQVMNYGTSNATFYTRCVVETITGTRIIYRDSTLIADLTPGSTSIVNYPSITLSGGKYRVKYTTLLADDVNSNNDEMTKVFRVMTSGYKDAGVSTIIQPSLEVQYQANYYPIIQVRNYSAQTEIVPASVIIKNTAPPYNIVYSSSISGEAILPFGTKTYVASTAWNAAVGVYEVIAYTRLSGDADPLNDTARTMVYCFTVDAGVISIYSPGAIAEPTFPVVCSAEVINRSWTTQSFNVTLKIGDDYSCTEQVNELEPAANKKIIFSTPYVQNIPGTYPIRCSTYLEGDARPQNDVKSSSVFVPMRDIQPVLFLDPAEDSIYPDIFEPHVVIQNNGNYRVTWAPVHLVIYKLNTFDDSTLVFEHTANLNLYEYSNAIAHFTNWNPDLSGPGNYRITATTLMNPDLVPDNNTITKTFYVKARFLDIYLVSVRSPGDTVGTGYPVIPKVTVKNNGNVSLPFGVVTEISRGGNLVYQPCTSYFSNPLPPNQEAQLYFRNFLPDYNNPGEYKIESRVIIQDDNPENDTASKNFIVNQDVYRDVEAVSIVSPGSNEIQLNTPQGYIDIRAKIKNNSSVNTNYNDLRVFFKITKKGRNIPIYEQIDSFELSRANTVGAEKTVSFPIWYFSYNDIGEYTVTCSTSFLADRNSNNNVKRINLKIVTGANAEWQNLTFIPVSSGVKDGGALTFVPDNDDYGNAGIYAFSGYKQPQFWKYILNEDNWYRKANLQNKKIGKGAALCNDGSDYIYAVIGNKTTEFWRYDIANDTWSILESVPLGPTNKKKLNGGSGLAFITRDNNHYVYLVKGNNTNEFYAYHIEQNTWSPKETIPKGDVYPKYGCALTTDGTNYIYLLKQKSNELLRYDVANNIWENRSQMFHNLTTKKVGAGSAMAYDLDNNVIYALKGNNTYEFWKYSVAEDRWTYLIGYEIPHGTAKKKVKDGGALAYANGYIYALKGNKTREFYRYIPGITNLNDGLKTQTITNVASKTNELTKNLSLTISPNIIKDFLKIKYSNGNTEPLNVKIYNVNGVLVYNEPKIMTTQNGIITIDISNLGAGIYFLQTENENNKFNQRIVVQK